MLLTKSVRIAGLSKRRKSIATVLIAVVFLSAFVVLYHPSRVGSVAAATPFLDAAVSGPLQLSVNQTGVFEASFTVPTHVETYRGWDFWTTHTRVAPDYDASKITCVWRATPSTGVQLQSNGTAAAFTFTQLTDEPVQLDATLTIGKDIVGGGSATVVPASQPKTLQLNLTSAQGQNPRLSVNETCTINAVPSFLNQYGNQTFAVPNGEDLTYSWLVTPRGASGALLSINGVEQSCVANVSVPIAGNLSSCILSYPLASDTGIWVNCKVVDQTGASATYSMSVNDPYSEPNVNLYNFAGSYSFLIQTDGNGWYQAINGTDGSIYRQSTNSSYIFNSCTNIAGTTTYVLNGLYVDDS